MVNIFNCCTEELKALVEYKDVTDNNVRFPKDFWTAEAKQAEGTKPICRILTRYCLEDLANIEVNELPSYNLKQIKQLLIDNKLFGMIQRVFKHDVLAILKNAYPVEFERRILREWMWSKHGIWNDKAAVVEAVQYMVRKEGIKRIKDIPQFDWKKRLLQHGIYNILAYFDWSIYSLFDFVYPNRFHPADFKYKTKWAAADSHKNAWYFMNKTFKNENCGPDDIKMLTSSDFGRMGLTGMLVTLFDSSVLKAKEYYFYKTTDNARNLNELKGDINKLREKKRDTAVKKRLSAVAEGKYIYNLHANSTLYSYIKRHAKASGMTIKKFITKHGFTYVTRKDSSELDKDEIWDLRKQGLTYVQIADKLGSNPTTITELCNRHFGGDPLIPRPLEDYITVQELMDRFRVDHKTIMRLVRDNNLENHMTIRFRYLNINEIVPVLQKYVKNSKHHAHMVNRYACL